MAIGFVYILSNPSFDSIKIGQTSKHPTHRVKELYEANTSVPTEFVLDAWVMIDKYELVERLLHKDLESYRVNSAREFFMCSTLDAISALEKIMEEHSILAIAVSDSWSDQNRTSLKEEKPGLVKYSGLTKCPSCNSVREYLIYEDSDDEWRININCRSCDHWYVETVRDLVQRRRNKWRE